jgi:hypothetical protein
MRARKKAAPAGAEVRFEQGYGDALRSLTHRSRV